MINASEKRIGHFGHFIDHDNGTVTDSRTGLMWKRFAEGQNWLGDTCTGPAGSFSFDSAKKIQQGFAGFDDWRLPTISELTKLIYRDRIPNLDDKAFPNSSERHFWSSSPCAELAGHGWTITTCRGSIGFAHFQNDSEHVRLVRCDLDSAYKATANDLPQAEIIRTDQPLVNDTRNLIGFFLDNGDGTIADSRTGLMWMRCAVGQRWDGEKCTGSPEIFPWQQATVLNHSFAGYDDWRLPEIKELESIVDRDRKDPAIDTNVFPMTPSRGFWSATANAENIHQAWSVLFAFGRAVHDEQKNTANYVRLVRDADFLLKSFQLNLIQGGTGSGVVIQTPDGCRHPIGSLLTLSATPEPGSVFVGWSGDLSESTPTCTLVMDSAKTVTANFSRLSFALDATASGSGTGSITRSLDAESYDYGSIVTVTARANDGSIFNGWHGDAEGLDASCTVKIDSAKRVTAEFVKLDIPDLEIRATFDSAEKSSMKSGDEAFILYLSIANNGQKQIHIELSLSSYVTRHGEEIEQDAWLTGLINGAQGATLRSGTFRKVGLVFFASKLRGISAGDHLHLTVSQSKPARRFNFTFRCADQQSRAFTLVDTVEGAQIQVTEEVVASSPDTAAMLQRIELLESGLSEVLRQLEALQAAGIPAVGNAPVPTLVDALTWLATQERVSLAVLRTHLLPLDLLPSAVIDELNERALDLTGEIALEESGEEIIVVSETLAAVIANLE